jgi:hypothetical protein
MPAITLEIFRETILPHITVDSIGLHVDPAYWGIGTSDYQFVNPTASIESWSNSNEHLFVYPNPATDFIIINNSENKDWTIINALGQLVIDKPKSNNRINITNLPNGLYYLVSKNNTSHQRFLINR